MAQGRGLTPVRATLLAAGLAALALLLIILRFAAG